LQKTVLLHWKQGMSYINVYYQPNSARLFTVDCRSQLSTALHCWLPLDFGLSLPLHQLCF